MLVPDIFEVMGYRLTCECLKSFTQHYVYSEMLEGKKEGVVVEIDRREKD